MFRRACSYGVVLVTGLLLLGASRLVAVPQANDAISDSAITTAIQAKLFQDPVLKMQDVRVSTQQGVVTLTGTVETELQQAAVDRIASTQPGVVKVIDGLSVAGSASEEAPPESADAQNPPPPETQNPPPAGPEAQNAYPPSNTYQDAVPATLTVPAGTLLTVRTTEALSSDHNQPGDNFTATLDRPLVSNGWVVMRRGQTVMGRVAKVRKAGRVKGTSQLGLELDRITLVDGQQLSIHTRLVEATAGSSKGRDASAIGTTTGVGAIIGAIAGGGGGAGIGAAAGAAAGVAGVLLARGRPTVLRPETLLTFRLESGLTISTLQSAQAAFRPVSQQDYPQQELQNRPNQFGVAPPRYAYYPPPYWGYYGWGPYYPYAFGLGYYSGWGRGYYRDRGYVRTYRGRGDRDWGRERERRERRR